MSPTPAVVLAVDMESSAGSMAAAAAVAVAPEAAVAAAMEESAVVVAVGAEAATGATRVPAVVADLAMRQQLCEPE